MSKKYILGISCFYHDSAATLIIDNEIVAAAQEERFSRIKHDPNFPVLAINYCLEEAGIADINEIDAVSSVPSFKNDITITKISEKILEKTRSNMKEWQRSLDPKRILKIAEFLDQCGNGIANAPMIFMPDSNFITFERNSSNEIYRVKIDFQFLKECKFTLF